MIQINSFTIHFMFLLLLFRVLCFRKPAVSSLVYILVILVLGEMKFSLFVWGGCPAVEWHSLTHVFYLRMTVKSQIMSTYAAMIDDVGWIVGEFTWTRYLLLRLEVRTVAIRWWLLEVEYCNQTEMWMNSSTYPNIVLTFISLLGKQSFLELFPQSQESDMNTFIELLSSNIVRVLTLDSSML